MKSSDHQTVLRAAAVLLLCGFASCAQQKNRRGGELGEGAGAGGWSDSSGTFPLPERNDNVAFTGPGSENVDRELFPPVYFAFDSSAIRASEAPKIETVAGHLARAGKSGSLIVGGFTDAVGSAEYNRQLGEYRALAVRRELVRRGVAADRVQTVSFGEDLPAVAGSGPAADAANRRAEFGLIR